MSKMNKRVFGLVAIKADMANWNADFTGRPKSTSEGLIYGSDKALKYAIKNYWQATGEEKVLYMKSYITREVEEKDKKAKKGEEKGKKVILQLKDLQERYDEILPPIDASTPTVEVLSNLFQAVDVENFGATFAVAGHNLGITGAVQIHQGINVFEDTNVEVQDILSPFRNSNKDDAAGSSIGKKIVVNEAHYVYPFSVNPNNYKPFEGIAKDFDGYSVEAYEKFKNASLIAATALNTNSKSGCYNEFAVFITCKEDQDLFLPPLNSYIKFTKDGDTAVYDVSKLASLIQTISDKIESVELFVDPYLVSVRGENELFVKKNLYTKEAL